MHAKNSRKYCLKYFLQYKGWLWKYVIDLVVQLHNHIRQILEFES